MGTLDKCSNCKEFMWEKHKCKPMFEVRCEKEGHDWKPIFAVDFDFAAEQWTDEYDSYDSDYFIAGRGGCIEVEVKDSEGVIKKFDVSGEMVAKYHAREVE